ncbi:MAG: 4'-phosphopantetheinyl transferase superfamily protein [Proteobacteria bacterium]|nr:4'-phosphopantetheinyl transferase superfamily protein [Pseudomonadota bacterium]
MPITILYYKVSPESISSAQQSEQIADWIEELPIIKQKQVKKLRQKNDQVLSLAGLQLLKIAMSEYTDNPFSLDQLQFPKLGKPFFKGGIDFNISHSGEIVCCVISDTAKVGIDIELQREVNPATLNKFVTESDCSVKETNTDDQKQLFFNLWTKNEAIIKAANLGSIYNMKDIKHEQNGGHYQNHFWSTYPVEIISVEDNKEYTCHIACSEYITLRKIKAKQIYNL